MRSRDHVHAGKFMVLINTNTDILSSMTIGLEAVRIVNIKSNIMIPHEIK